MVRKTRYSNGRYSSKNKLLALTLVLGLGVIEPAINPPAAEACFFWQACARRRGRASNTRAGGKRTGHLVGGNDPSLPYVISPRNAWIRQPELGQQLYTIRWNSVEGASSYTVRLWRWTFERDQPELALWETTVENANETPFPALVLDPGSYYSIQIMTNTGISSDLDAGYYESGFQLLFEEDYEVLRSHLTEVTPAVPNNTALTDENFIEEVALAKAGVFFLEEMYADALAILQSLASRPTASDLVYTALGDTYSQSGLNQLAIDTYQQALALAIANFDILSEATIRVNLADVYATLGRFEEALQQLNQARSAYAHLKDETEVVILDRRIAILSTRLSRQHETEPIP